MLRGVTVSVLCLGLVAGCAGGPEWVHPYGATHPMAGTIYDVEAGRPVNTAALVEKLAAADYILVGESPDNLDHHRLEAELVGRLGRSGPQLKAVAFELIDMSQQPVVVEYLSSHKGEVRGLDEALAWDERGWPPYAGYQPILAAALDAGAEIVAAGLSVTMVEAVMRDGLATLPAPLAERTGLTEPLPPEVMEGLARSVAADNCGAAPADLLDRLVQLERARAASLADRLVTVTGRGQGLLIAGVGQVRKDWGVPWYVHHLRSGARVASLAFVEVDKLGQERPDDLPYDFVWFTPGAHPPGTDGCGPPDGGAGQIDASTGASTRGALS